MSARATTHLLLALLALLAASSALAAPCIECNQCSTSNCFSTCQMTCPASSPSSPTVAGQDCESYGRVAGSTSAQSACSTTLEYCKTRPATMATAAFANYEVSLTQCENIAFGVCQQTAKDASKSPCGYGLTGGYQECSKDDFASFYNKEVDDLCRTNVQNIAP